MSENKIYEKIDWNECCNGSMEAEYLERQIWRAIIKAAYEKPLTISEISAATGIPCMYIEDELQHLLYGEVLTEENGKYAANIIIQGKDLLKKAAELRDKAIKDTDLSNKVLNILDRYESKIRSIGFIGSDRPKNELWWVLIALVIREAAGKMRSLSGLERPPYPHRKDGGNGWLFAQETTLEEEWEDGAGCHSYDREKNVVENYTFYKHHKREIDRYFYKLAIDNCISETPKIDLQAISDVELAEGIKYNLIEKTADGYKWSLMFFTAEQMKKFKMLITEMANELADFSENLSNALLEIYETYKKNTPKRLHDQIKGVISHLHGSEAAICYALEENGTLAKPDHEYFTKTILVVRK